MAGNKNDKTDKSIRALRSSTAKLPSSVEPPTSETDAVKFDFCAEFRRFLSNEENVALLRSAIAAPLLEEVRQLKETIIEKDEIIDSLKSQLTSLEEKNDEMEEKYDELEQYSRRNSLRFIGLPETSSEDCYAKTVDVLNNSLNLDPPLELSDLDRVHRCGKPKMNPAGSRPMLIKFATYRQRQRVMTNRSTLRGTDMFLNEDLTPRRAKLLKSVRDAKREGQLKDAWTADGRIRIRNNANQVHLIKSLLDLTKHLQLQRELE